MHLGTSLLAFAAGRAMLDGIERGRALAAVDRAHQIGQRRYAATIQRKRAALAENGDASAAWLNRERRRIHG